MRKLEEQFPDELVVIGVHSGKFIAERVTENIRQAVLRYGVHHPVVNDRQYRIWRAYAVSGWPTLTLINPDGRIVGQQAGEIPAEELAEAVGQVVAEAESAGTLDRTPLAFTPEQASEPDHPLLFPAKLLADEESGRLFIADTGHERVVVVRLDEDGRSGSVEAVVGSGEAGFRDGGFEDAEFRQPHGLALDGDLLYVADTENHAVRAVDLAGRRVETVAGDGTLARGLSAMSGEPGTPLRSPWDLLIHEGLVYIAMAGTHQIWRLDPATAQLQAWAGSGAEALYDGPRGRAALAQPSGLAADGRRLFFADAEASAIRWIDLAPSGSVHTLVGTGLFDFGDKDGTGDEVRLQHALGVAWHDGAVYVADTYNGKIKVVDPETRGVRTIIGEVAGLWEPGGLAVAGDRIYIADTNHHRVVVGRVGEEGVEEVDIRGL